MGAYGSLYILKKLNDGVNPVMHKVYEKREKADYKHDFLNLIGVGEDEELGFFQFFDIDGEVYFKLLAHHPILRQKMMEQVKYGFHDYWLLNFTFDEMKVAGNNRFYAITDSSVANERLLNIPHKELNKEIYWLAKRDRLRLMLLDSHTSEIETDKLVFDTADVYYSDDEDKKDGSYVKNIINEQVKEMKSKLYIPHWQKTAVKN